MAKDAWYFLLPLFALAILLLYLGWIISLTAVLVLAGFVAFFFRDPEREIPQDNLDIVSPADGRVVRIAPAPGGGSRLSIFLSVFNVHVNRAPISGAIVRQEYRSGKFLVASDDRASVQNEQLVITIKGRQELTFALIAGIVARRIVPWRKLGDQIEKGDRIALIRFGSRADVFLPENSVALVKRGDRVKGGGTVIARWREEQ